MSRGLGDSGDYQVTSMHQNVKRSNSQGIKEGAIILIINKLKINVRLSIFRVDNWKLFSGGSCKAIALI